MSRISRRAVAIGVLAIVPVVSGCGAGKHPQTALPSQLTEGVNAEVHEINLRNLFVLGPQPGQRLAVRGDAPVYTTIVNTGSAPDRLVAVEAPGLAGAVQVANGAITLPPTTLVTTNQPVTITPAPTPGTPSASGSPTPTPRRDANRRPPARRAPATVAPVTLPSTLMLKGLARELTGAETVRLVFHFERAGTLSVNVPVQAMQGYYATYSPAPTPTTPQL